MEKEFIGKVFEKTFSNGGSVIKLTLSQQDKHLIAGRSGDTTIEVKKSKGGKWYAEISQYQSQPQQPVATNYNDLPPIGGEESELPF